MIAIHFDINTKLASNILVYVLKLNAESKRYFKNSQKLALCKQRLKLNFESFKLNEIGAFNFDVQRNYILKHLHTIFMFEINNFLQIVLSMNKIQPFPLNRTLQ